MSARIVRVGRAATGLGLFAVKPIAAKAYIVTYRGKRIPTKEAHRREREAAAKYMFEIDGRWTIDGSSRRNLGRYINHACRANCEAVLRKGQMVFVALRNIAPGEEITLDYGKDYFDLFIAPLGCRCAACARRAAKIYGKSGKPARRGAKMR
jgi:SET domain-containing protein